MSKKASLPTAYSSPKQLERRLWESRADGPKYLRSRVVTVKFAESFDVFAARTAHELRESIYYKPDGGKVARGLVRASGRLKDIHREYQEDGSDEGDPIRLFVVFTRRMALPISNQWVLSIDFGKTQTEADFDSTEEGDVVTRNPREMAAERLGRAILIAGNVKGGKGNRIRAYLKLADTLKWPRNLDLWYYNPHAVRYFVNANEETRKIIFQKAGGRFPLQGRLEGIQLQGRLNWVEYPFKELLPLIDDSTSVQRIQNWLGAMEENVTSSLKNLVTGRDISGSQTGLDKARLLVDFRKHMSSLWKHDRNHLYYHHLKNTTDDRGFFEKYF